MASADQDMLYKKIRVLDNNAKFDIRPYDVNNPLCKDSVNINGYAICWNANNVNPIPSASAIDAVTKEQVDANEEVLRKSERNRRYNLEPIYKEGFKNYKVLNPAATFSDYMDYLETL